MRLSCRNLSRAFSAMLESQISQYQLTEPKPKVLVTCSDVPSAYIDALKTKCDVRVCPGSDRNEILKACPGAEGILWLTADRLDADVLDTAGPQLKVVSTMTSGMDYVDAGEFQRRQIALGHTPHVVNGPVADIAVGLMLAAARRFHEGRLAILNSAWEMRPQWMLGQDVTGSTVGIVGFGGIGQTILKRLQGFEIGKCIYTGRNRKPEDAQLGATYVDFDTLLKESDFIFIACPLTGETAKMFNDEAFSRMKATSVLVNVARGGIVDQNALVNALKNGTIFAAGLDVMTPEPLEPSDPLLSLPNCIIAPHLGTATRKSLEDMFSITARNVLSVLSGGKLISPFAKG